MVGERQFRKVMGEYATGVTIVASRDSTGRPVGLTVNAFTSVSLRPPTVLVCIHHDADAHDPLLDAGHFGVSVLGAAHEDLALRFSRADAELRFKDLPVVEGALGSPLITGALAWLECRVTEVCGSLDHSIILAEVVSCDATEGDPLLFFRGALTGLAP